MIGTNYKCGSLTANEAMINKAEAVGTYIKGACPEKSYKCEMHNGYKVCFSHWNKSEGGEGAEETDIDPLHYHSEGDGPKPSVPTVGGVSETVHWMIGTNYKCGSLTANEAMINKAEAVGTYIKGACP